MWKLSYINSPFSTANMGCVIVDFVPFELDQP